LSLIRLNPLLIQMNEPINCKFKQLQSVLGYALYETGLERYDGTVE
jgi:hypothetical protein